MEPSSTLPAIEGWLTFGEGRVLEEAARACPADVAIVEIGSFKGRSTQRLGTGAREGHGAPVFAIDPHEEGTYPEFLENLRASGLDGIVEPVCQRSEDAAREWDRPIGLLFIDGDHSRESVERDWRLFSPHLVDGAVVAFHDSTAAPTRKLMGYPGPRAVAGREFFGSPGWRDVGVVDTLTYATRGDASRRDRAWRHLVHLRKLGTDALLLLNAHVVRRLPLFPVLKRLVFGKAGPTAPEAERAARPTRTPS
ncbi:MAG: class I SAM-dependent methyltransferase [Gemmatimonadota bacterium]|nr:class I SAM-dependent methyltransferase [Gemmatimonadota bacterium]